MTTSKISSRRHIGTEWTCFTVRWCARASFFFNSSAIRSWIRSTGRVTVLHLSSPLSQRHLSTEPMFFFFFEICVFNSSNRASDHCHPKLCRSRWPLAWMLYVCCLSLKFGSVVGQLHLALGESDQRPNLACSTSGSPKINQKRPLLPQTRTCASWFSAGQLEGSCSFARFLGS